MRRTWWKTNKQVSSPRPPNSDMDMLSLKHFILRQRVIQLYRLALRASRCAYFSLRYIAVSQDHSHTRPTHTRRDTRLVSRRDRAQQAPHRYREFVCFSPVHASCSLAGGNSKPARHRQQRNPTALSRNTGWHNSNASEASSLTRVHH